MMESEMIHVKATIRICGWINVSERIWRAVTWKMGMVPRRCKERNKQYSNLVDQIMEYKLLTASQTMQRKIKEILNKQRRFECQ